MLEELLGYITFSWLVSTGLYWLIFTFPSNPLQLFFAGLGIVWYLLNK